MCMRLSMGFEHVHLKKGVCMKGKLTAGRDSVPEPLLEGCCGVSGGTSEGDVVGLMRSGCVCAGSFSCGGWRFWERDSSYRREMCDFLAGVTFERAVSQAAERLPEALKDRREPARQPLALHNNRQPATRLAITIAPRPPISRFTPRCPACATRHLLAPPSLHGCTLTAPLPTAAPRASPLSLRRSALSWLPACTQTPRFWSCDNSGLHSWRNHAATSRPYSHLSSKLSRAFLRPRSHPATTSVSVVDILDAPSAAMSPTPNSYVATQLRQLIYYHLDNDLVQNALFLASRLHAQEPRSADAAHLLALCHLRLGRLKAAYDYSREKGFRGQHLGCAYVFAQACLGLERYPEGITALDRARGFWGGRNHWSKCTFRHGDAQ